MRPDIGEKLSGFIALSPAVYAGPHTTSWLFTTLGKFEWDAWARLFGEFVLAFLCPVGKAC